MGTQISLQLSDRLYSRANTYAESRGYDTLQDFIRELIRERLFGRDTESYGGMFTSASSEESLSRNWLSKEEDEAWEHLQEGT